MAYYGMYGMAAQAVGRATKAAAKAAGVKFPGDKPKRRRRARLTQADIMELTHIRNMLGRTAAANALPFYLGRGRG